MNADFILKSGLNNLNLAILIVFKLDTNQRRSQNR